MMQKTITKVGLLCTTLIAVLTLATTARAQNDHCYMRDTIYEQHTMCEGDSLLWRGMTLHFGGTSSVVDTLASNNGMCDTLMTHFLRLTTLSAPRFAIEGSANICSGRASQLSFSSRSQYSHITWHGTNIEGSTDDTVAIYAEGLYALTLTDSIGCHATDSLYVTMRFAHRYDTIITHCQDDPVAIDTNIFDQEGAYRIVLSDIYGCDSIINLQVNLLSLPDVIVAGAHIFCEGDTLCIAADGAYDYRWSTGDESPMTCITSGGDYSLDAYSVDGCLTHLDLHIPHFPTYTRHHYDTICDGGLYTFFGRELTQAGNYTMYDTTRNGCDSSDRLHLAVRQLATGEEYATASDSLLWNGEWRTMSGTYSKRSRGSNGCDSTTLLHLTLLYGAPLPHLVLIDERLLAFDHYQSYTSDGWHGYIAYRWFRNGHLIRNARNDYYHNPNYTPLEGCFHAEVAVDNEQTTWVSTDTVCVNTAGITTSTADPVISPNPATAGRTVAISGDQWQQIDLVGYDGRPLASTSISNTLTIPASLNAGIYLIIATDSTGHRYTQRITIR